jgi:hypothetical protein
MTPRSGQRLVRRRSAYAPARPSRRERRDSDQVQQRTLTGSNPSSGPALEHPFRALKFRRFLRARLPLGAKVPMGARRQLETPSSGSWTERIAPTQKRDIRMTEPYSATTRSLRRPAVASPSRCNGHNRIDRSLTCPPGQPFRSHADRAAARKVLVTADVTEPRVALDADSNRFRAAHRLLTPLTPIGDVRSAVGPPPVRKQIHRSPCGGRRITSLSFFSNHFGQLSLLRKIRGARHAHIERKTSFASAIRPRRRTTIVGR